MSHAFSFPRGGHEVRLLQGSVELFPALVAAIEAAQRDVRLETYIFDFTGESVGVAQALEHAARRGVSVRVLVDGFGTAPLPPDWRERFGQAGVRWRVYAPLGWLGMLRLGSWHRLHRKLCVVDGKVAFCGGINVLDDFHDPSYGRLKAPRLDFAVRVTGPLVAEVDASMGRGGFVVQAAFRSLVFGTSFVTSLLPITGLAFVLFTFYMVTDPATTPVAPLAQVVFGASVALAYGALMYFHIVFGLFFALTAISTLRGLNLYAQSALATESSQKPSQQFLTSLFPMQMDKIRTFWIRNRAH